jgi:hypothetical protein
MNKKLIFGIAIILLIIIGFGLSSYFLCYNKGNGFFCNPFSNSKPGAVSGIKIVKVESFTDKIQLQMQNDQTYKIYWPDVSNKGTGDPTKFFYQYFVWKGSNPSYTSSTPSPDQTNKTVSPSFVLNPDLSTESDITVIITANNEFGASPDALQTFSLQQAPSINSVQFNSSSVIGGLFTSNPGVIIQLNSMGDGENPIINSYIKINKSGNLVNTINQKTCTSIADMKAQCFFDIPSTNLYGGFEFTPYASAQNKVGKSSLVSGAPFGQPRLLPRQVANIELETGINPNPVPVFLKFMIKYSPPSGPILYMTYDKTQNWLLGTPDKSKASIFEVDPNGRYKEITTGLFLNANPNGSDIQLKEFIKKDVVFYEWTINEGNLFLTNGTSYGNVAFNAGVSQFVFDKIKDSNFSLVPI